MRLEPGANVTEERLRLRDLVLPVPSARTDLVPLRSSRWGLIACCGGGGRDNFVVFFIKKYDRFRTTGLTSDLSFR